jgi:hypothetical protein
LVLNSKVEKWLAGICYRSPSRLFMRRSSASLCYRIWERLDELAIGLSENCQGCFSLDFFHCISGLWGRRIKRYIGRIASSASLSPATTI